MEWVRTTSKPYYDSTMRWVEDTYLKYFGENRASYGTKEALHKAEITGIEDVNRVQRSVGDAAANTLGNKGLLGGLGSAIDKGALRGNV